MNLRKEFKINLEAFMFMPNKTMRSFRWLTSMKLNSTKKLIDRLYPTAALVPISVMNPLFHMLNHTPAASMFYWNKLEWLWFRWLVRDTAHRKLYIVDWDVMIKKEKVLSLTPSLFYTDNVNLLLQSDMFYDFVSEHREEIDTILNR